MCHQKSPFLGISGEIHPWCFPMATVSLRRRLPRGHRCQCRPVLRRHGVAGGQGRRRRRAQAAAQARGARQPTA